MVELLIAMAIVALIAALAYPSYHAQVLRAHRSEAIEALLAAAAEQEKYHLANGRYAEALAADVEPPSLGLPLAELTPGRRYRLTLQDAGPVDFTAVATAREGGGQDLDTRCAMFTIRADGRRSASDREGMDTTRDCWR